MHYAKQYKVLNELSTQQHQRNNVPQQQLSQQLQRSYQCTSPQTVLQGLPRCRKTRERIHESLCEVTSGQDR